MLSFATTPEQAESHPNNNLRGGMCTFYF